jgi:hypothetical protein
MSQCTNPSPKIVPISRPRQNHLLKLAPASKAMPIVITTAKPAIPIKVLAKPNAEAWSELTMLPQLITGLRLQFS